MKPTERNHAVARNLWRGMDENGNWHEGALSTPPNGTTWIMSFSVDNQGLVFDKEVEVLPHTVGQWTTKEIDGSFFRSPC